MVEVAVIVVVGYCRSATATQEKERVLCLLGLVK